MPETTPRLTGDQERPPSPIPDDADALVRELALLAHALGTCTTMAEVHGHALRSARALLQADRASLGRLDQDDWTVLASSPPSDAHPRTGRQAAGDVVGRLVRRRVTWTVALGDADDGSLDLGEPAEVAYLRASGQVTALTTPLVVNDVVWGALHVSRDPGGRAFTNDDAPRAEVLAALVAAAVARLDVTEQVRHLVQDDALTGLSTRRVADEAAQRAVDSGDETCIVMCDVDGLKRVNDELGHDAGDDLLRAVAAVLRHASEGLPGSTAARIGGDEFCVVTSGIPRTTVVQVVENAVGENALPYGASLSYGIASASRGPLGPPLTPRMLFRRADAAQYRAKRSHAAERARQFRADDPDAVLGRMTVAGVAALTGAGAGLLSRLCALAAAASEAMGGSAWAVLRTLDDDAAVVAQGGTSSLHVSGVASVRVDRAPWSIDVETTIPAARAALESTLHTLLDVAVHGAR